MILDEPGLYAERDKRRRHDWPLIGTALALVSVGLVAMSSVDMAVSTRAGVFGSFAAKQAIFAVLGIIGMLAVSFANTALWQRLSGVLYWGNLALLSGVLLFGKTINGSKRWLMVGNVQLQPSDFSKLILVLTIAAFFAANADKVREWRTVWRSLLHIAAPIALLVAQPHYGGAACVFAAWLLISLYAGVRWSHVGAVLGALVVLLGAGFAAPQVFRGVLKGYQLERMESKVNEVLHGKSDKQATAYQPTQSAIAIALGGATGAGYGRGEWKRAKAVPEQESDFVFSVVGEELGFAGSAFVLGLYGFFLYRVWLASFRCGEHMDRMVAAGVLAVIGFHTVTNLAMALNIGLVIGLWLPFMSQGGTAMITCLAMVGIVDSLR